MALVMPAYQTLSQYCSVDLMRDANRQQICGRIAEVLAGHSTDLFERAFGQRIGERVGWPAERMLDFKARMQANTDAVDFEPDLRRDPSGCSAARAALKYFGDMAEVGEWEAGRLAVQRKAGAGGDRP